MNLPWIKLYQKSVESRVFSKGDLWHIWSWILLKANWKTGYFQGHEIPPGSVASSYESIASTLGCSKTSVRSRLKKLEEWGMISLESKRYFTVISVCNWHTYQNSSHVNENAKKPEREQKKNAKKTQKNQNVNRNETEPEHNKNGTKTESDPIVDSIDFIDLSEVKTLNTFRPTSSSQDEFQLQPEFECSLSAMPVDADNDPPLKQKQPRKPRPLFDAIAQVCGFTSSDITESLGKQIGKAERELKGFEVTPEQVLQFPSLWKKWPCKNDPIQPHNLIKHAAAIKQIKSTNTIVAAENDPQYAAKEELRMAQNWLENQLKWVKKNEFNLQKYYSEEERKNISDAIEHKKARITELQNQLQEGVA